MQNLSAQASGNACTIKWMFGAPEILNFLREGHIEEGSTVKVIQNFCGNMIVSAAGRQFAVSKDIAKYNQQRGSESCPVLVYIKYKKSFLVQIDMVNNSS